MTTDRRRLPQVAWERQGWTVAGPELTNGHPAWSLPVNPTQVDPAQPDPELRIGDAERDTAIAELGDHFAAGRLNREEFDERSGRAMQARRQVDLAPLFADLPKPVPAGPPAMRRGPDPRWPLFWLAPMLLVAAVVTAVVTSTPWVIWLVVTLFLFSGPWRRRAFAMQHGQHPVGRRGPG